METEIRLFGLQKIFTPTTIDLELIKKVDPDLSTFLVNNGRIAIPNFNGRSTDFEKFMLEIGVEIYSCVKNNGNLSILQK